MQTLIKVKPNQTWLVRIESASSPAEIIINAGALKVDEAGAEHIALEYRGNDVVETEDFRKYGRIILTPFPPATE